MKRMILFGLLSVMALPLAGSSCGNEDRGHEPEQTTEDTGGRPEEEEEQQEEGVGPGISDNKADLGALIAYLRGRGFLYEESTRMWAWMIGAEEGFSFENRANTFMTPTGPHVDNVEIYIYDMQNLSPTAQQHIAHVEANSEILILNSLTRRYFKAPFLLLIHSGYPQKDALRLAFQEYTP